MSRRSKEIADGVYEGLSRFFIEIAKGISIGLGFLIFCGLVFVACNNYEIEKRNEACQKNPESCPVNVALRVAPQQVEIVNSDEVFASQRFQGCMSYCQLTYNESDVLSGRAAYLCGVDCSEVS